MASYRNSQLRLLPQCRFAYKRTYLDGVDGAPSPVLAGGQAVHAGINEAVRRIVRGDPFLDVHDVAFRVVRGGPVEYQSALRVLTRFQEALGVEFDIEPARVFLVEERLEMSITLPDGTAVTFYGTPDLAERASPKTVRITDWKTHHVVESQEAFEADPQLPRYAVLIDDAFPGYERFHLVKRFVRWRDAYRERWLTRADLDQVRLALASEIAAARDIEAAGDFAPTGGDWCALCQHHADCPLIRRYREQGVDWIGLQDEDDARRAASDLCALEGFTDRLKDGLKRYLGADHPSGFVPVAGGTYGYGPVQHQETDVAPLRAHFEQHGAALPDTVLKVDNKELEKLRKRLPDALGNAIEACTRRWQSTQFRFRKHPHSQNPARPEELV